MKFDVDFDENMGKNKWFQSTFHGIEYVWYWIRIHEGRLIEKDAVTLDRRDPTSWIPLLFSAKKRESF